MQRLRLRGVLEVGIHFAGRSPDLYLLDGKADGQGVYLCGAVDEAGDEAPLYCLFAGDDHCSLFDYY